MVQVVRGKMTPAFHLKIRAQLVLLVLGAAVCFLLSIGFYSLLLAPLDRMETEFGSFQELSRATSNLEVEAGKLLLVPLGPQTQTLQAALDGFHRAQAEMAKVEVLTKANAALGAAVEAVVNLAPLSQSAIEAVVATLAEVRQSAEMAKVPFDEADWTDLSHAVTGTSEAAVTSYRLDTLVRQLKTLDEVLDTTRRVVEKKDVEIRGEIVKIKTQSSLAGLGVILLTVTAAVVFSFLLAQNIARAIQALGTTVALVGQGDLRVRFGSRRADELGVLSKDLDQLLDGLTLSFRRIQEASSENLAVKDQLALSVSTATSSSTEIEASSASILNQLRRVDDRVRDSGSELQAIIGLLDAFRTRLAGQTEEVARAAGTVSDLTLGIGTISGLSEENRQAVERLKSESALGREVFDRSFEKIALVNDRVSDIQELAVAIAEIAGQTNILSLNAAIEAAHAGEAGKGFAVVADEISKLASASAASSAQIAATIHDVVSTIRQAGETRVETLAAFEAMQTQIETVTERSRRIDDESDRMNAGADRIRQGMETLSSGFALTTNEANRIGTGTTNLGTVLSELGLISHEVVSNISEITLGLSEITRTVGEVAAQADRLGLVGADLDDAVNSFQTR